jgi:hypothetical protein
MKKNTFAWITVSIMIILSVAATSCDHMDPDVTPPISINFPDASSLGYVEGWMSQDDLYFVWNAQTDPKILGLNLSTSAVSIIPTPGLRLLPFVTINRNGTLMAYTGFSSELIIFDLVEEKVISEIEGTTLAFSPEGEEFVVWHRQRQLFLSNLSSPELELLYEIDDEAFDQGIRLINTEWRPGFNQVAFLLSGFDYGDQNEEGVDEIILLDLETLETTVIISINGWIPDFSWSPNGALLAYSTSPESTNEGRLSIFDVQNSCDIGSVRTKWGPIAHWSPDGENIVHHDGVPLDILNIYRHFGISYEYLTCPTE